VKKNAALLSFEDDEGGDGDGDDGGGGKPAAAARIRSAHEAIDDARHARFDAMPEALLYGRYLAFTCTVF
jgi:hypothetical protein